MYAVNLHALEMFPTCLRQTGVSLLGMCSSAFGTLGPYIILVVREAYCFINNYAIFTLRLLQGKYTNDKYKFVTLGILSAAAGLTGVFLPETLLQRLPETLQEANDFGMPQSF